MISNWVTFVTSQVYRFIFFLKDIPELENIVAFKSIALLLLIVYRIQFITMQIQLSSLDNRQSKLLKTKGIYCWQSIPIVEPVRQTIRCHIMFQDTAHGLSTQLSQRYDCYACTFKCAF